MTYSTKERAMDTTKCPVNCLADYWEFTTFEYDGMCRIALTPMKVRCQFSASDHFVRGYPDVGDIEKWMVHTLEVPLTCEDIARMGAEMFGLTCDCAITSDDHGPLRCVCSPSAINK